MDHYQYLGVGRSASPNQIEAAARLALWRCGSDLEQSQLIMGAWYVVGDPDRRFDYDFWLLTHPTLAEPDDTAKRGAVPRRIPAPRVPRAPGLQPAAGPLQPVGSLPSPPVAVPPAAASTKYPPQLDSVTPSWREDGPEIGKSHGPRFNPLRLLALHCLVAVALGLMTVLVDETPSAGRLPVNAMCWFGLVLIGRLWPRAGSADGNPRNR